MRKEYPDKTNRLGFTLALLFILLLPLSSAWAASGIQVSNGVVRVATELSKIRGDIPKVAALVERLAPIRLFGREEKTALSVVLADLLWPGEIPPPSRPFIIGQTRLGEGVLGGPSTRDRTALAVALGRLGYPLGNKLAEFAEVSISDYQGLPGSETFHPIKSAAEIHAMEVSLESLSEEEHDISLYLTTLYRVYRGLRGIFGGSPDLGPADLRRELPEGPQTSGKWKFLQPLFDVTARIRARTRLPSYTEAMDDLARSRKSSDPHVQVLRFIQPRQAIEKLLRDINRYFSVVRQKAPNDFFFED